MEPKIPTMKRKRSSEELTAGSKTRTMKRNRFCKEWIDGTTLHSSPSSGSTICTDTDPGIAWLLYEQCLTVLSNFVTLSSRKSFMAEDILETLKELIGSLYLWGSSLEEGRLNSALSQSKDLEDTIRDLLLSISETILQGLLPSLRTHASVEERAVVDDLWRELYLLIEKARIVATADKAKENSDCESLYPQTGDEPCDDNRTIESLKKAASHLMGLLPLIDDTLTFLKDFPMGYLRSCRSGSTQNDTPEISGTVSEVSIPVERLQQPNLHGNMVMLSEENVAHGISPEPCDVDIDMEDQSKSHLGPPSVFYDSGLGTSQSSCRASPSSTMSTIEEDESTAL